MLDNVAKNWAQNSHMCLAQVASSSNIPLKVLHWFLHLLSPSCQLKPAGHGLICCNFCWIACRLACSARRRSISSQWLLRQLHLTAKLMIEAARVCRPVSNCSINQINQLKEVENETAFITYCDLLIYFNHFQSVNQNSSKIWHDKSHRNMQKLHPTSYPR